MDNMLAAETRYRGHQQRIDSLAARHQQFDGPVRRYPVRRVVAKVLIALATVATPPAKREMHTA
jgi:hypothetical protein